MFNLTMNNTNKVEKDLDNSNNAIVVDKQLFLTHWDDFCYPSSDDVFMWPNDLSWVLFYSHEEVFFQKEIVMNMSRGC